MDSIHIITSNKSNQYLHPLTSNNQTDSKMIISVLISTISQGFNKEAHMGDHLQEEAKGVSRKNFHLQWTYSLLVIIHSPSTQYHMNQFMCKLQY